MKVHNIKISLFNNFKIFSKVKKILSFRKAINFVGIIVEGYFAVKKPKFRPYAATIETSRLCNLECKFCPNTQAESQFKESFLEFRLFKKFVDNNPQLFFLFFTGNGEPCLNNNLSEMIEYANRKKIITILSTNGTINLEKNVSPDFLIFSLDYINKKDYVNYKGRDLFDSCFKNISQYNKVKSAGTITFLQFFINIYENLDYDRFFEMGFRLACNFVVLKRAVIYNQNFSGLDPQNKFLEYSKSTKDGLYCKYIYYQTYLTSEGLIAPCCNDLKSNNILGCIALDEFSSVWNGSKYENIRQDNKRGRRLYDFCQYCPRLHKKSPIEYIFFIKR